MQEHPELPVLVLTGLNEVDTAVQCMKEGAFDYLLKPVEEDAPGRFHPPRDRDGRHAPREPALRSAPCCPTTLEHPEAFAAIVTGNKAMRSLFRYAEAIAATPLPGAGDRRDRAWARS